ncbi:MAG: SgcJ/EcaC family oxidoreductase [Polyangiaceae bacterium]
MAHEEQTIRQLHSIWIDAVNAGELDRLLALTTDDVVFLSPGQAPADRAGFASNFSIGHEQARIRCSSELEEVVVAGDVAYARSRDALTVTPRTGGRETRLEGHRITVYRKQADGRWLLARDAHTLSPVVGV